MKAVEEEVSKLNYELGSQLVEIRHAFKLTAGKQVSEEVMDKETGGSTRDAQAQLQTVQSELRKAETNAIAFKARVAELEAMFETKTAETKEIEKRMSVRS
jgi:hypothetical protein